MCWWRRRQKKKKGRYASLGRGEGEDRHHVKGG